MFKYYSHYQASESKVFFLVHHSFFWYISEARFDLLGKQRTLFWVQRKKAPFFYYNDDHPSTYIYFQIIMITLKSMIMYI